VGAHERDDPLDRVVEAGARRQLRARGGCRDQRVAGGRDHRGVQALAGAEVVEDERARHVLALGEGLDRELVERPRREERDARGDQLCAPILPRQAPTVLGGHALDPTDEVGAVPRPLFVRVLSQRRLLID
jgi:hypothetical protein